MTHEFPDGWQSKPLSDLGEYQNGRAFKPSDWGTEGLPIIRIAQINNPYSETNYYSGKDVQEKHLIRDGDLLFSWSATLTALLWRNGNGILNQHIFKVVENEGVDKNFLLYTILHSIDGLAAHSHGTTMKHIKKGVLNKYHVGVPPLPEQKKIAEVLSSVDEAIAATKAVIDQTKQVKKGLLQTLLTKGTGHTKFKQTELGVIPSTWRVARVSEVVEEKNGILTGPFGSMLSGSDFTDEGVPVLKIGNVREGYIDTSKMNFVSAEKAVQLEKYRVRNGDLLFARQGATTGRNSLSRKKHEGWLINYHIIRVRPNTSICNPDFLYTCFNSNSFISQVTENKGRGNRDGINCANISSFKFPLPPIEEGTKIGNKLAEVDQIIYSAEQRVSCLATLKLGLMSDLLTGRKRVEVLDA
ncbi:restriction endonuclease subunit S [Emcibacter sp.]|uniref:restriction endonuclease subunit S n=1 Tax=Emcibacter sp. TaxID=1979954 RepID=UPI003A90381F